MNARLRPLLIALAAASLVSLGALLWLVGDLISSSDPAGKQPSLLDILDEVRKGDLGRHGRPAAAPRPPNRAARKTAVVLADWMRRHRIRADHITTHRQVDLGGLGLIPATSTGQPWRFGWRPWE